MNQIQTPKKVPLDNEEFYIGYLIGIEDELPDKIILEWKNGRKLIYEYKNDNWYEMEVEQ